MISALLHLFFAIYSLLVTPYYSITQAICYTIYIYIYIYSNICLFEIDCITAV